MIKLISIDLDGTTLDNDHKLGAVNRAALTEAMNRGVKVVVNTGRHYTAARPVAQEIGTDMPVICNNGARIVDMAGERLLYHCPLTAHQVKMLALECRKQDWTCAASLNSIIYTDVLPEVAEKWKVDGFNVDIELMGSRFYDGNLTADSMLVLIPAPEIYIAQDHLRGKFGEELHVAVSMPPCIDIMSMAAGKGKSLMWLAGNLGIQHDEIMAVGDSFNDIDMLEAAGIAVAVGNAHPALKEIAGYVAADNDKNGVAAAIEKFVLRR